MILKLGLRDVGHKNVKWTKVIQTQTNGMVLL